MADPNTPAWLSEPAPAPAASAPGQPQAVAPPPAPTASNTNNNNASTRRAPMTEAEITADDADLPGVILTMRLANMGAAVALIVVAVRGKKEHLENIQMYCQRFTQIIYSISFYSLSFSLQIN